MTTYDAIRAEGSNIRVHGNGFIQIDMPDRARVHCWGHPEIPRQVVPSQIHDHSFSFMSAVLAGSLVNVRYGTNKGGTYDVYKPIPRQGEDTRLELVGKTDVFIASMELLRPGQSYAMSAGKLHETFANRPTVTHMLKVSTDKEVVPRVLIENGKQPDNDFNRYAFDDTTLWRIVKECFE